MLSNSKHLAFCLSRSISAPCSDSYWFARLDHKDWLAPNEVIKIFTNIRDPNLISSAFKKVTDRRDYKPNEALYSLMVDKLAYACQFGEIDHLLGRAKYENFHFSDEFFYKLIKMYGNVANHPEKAIATLFRMHEFHCWPSIKIFNYVLNMLVCARQLEAIHEVYASASRLGITIDTCCFNILIKGLCQLDKLDAAFSLLREMPKQGCKPNVRTYSTLMCSLCKEGRVDEAFVLFRRMEEHDVLPDTVSFNILISGLCRQGRVVEGLDLLKTMKFKGCSPNSGTYQALLYGFLSSKQFAEAKDFICMMISEGVKPSFSSFKLTIDGLCCEKRLDDAHLVLRHMVDQGFVPRMGTWKNMLNCPY